MTEKTDKYNEGELIELAYFGYECGIKRMFTKEFSELLYKKLKEIKK